MRKKSDEDDPKFWGWCECNCRSCEMGNHHFCRDRELCRMPKTFKKDEKPDTIKPKRKR